MQDFRKLKVWGKNHSLTLEIYKATEPWGQLVSWNTICFSLGICST
jgi:hypothetical protein